LKLGVKIHSFTPQRKKTTQKPILGKERKKI